MKTISMEYSEYKKDLEEKENYGITMGIYTASQLLTGNLNFEEYSKNSHFLKDDDLRYLKRIYDHFHKEAVDERN